MKLKARDRVVEFPRRPLVMGIVNRCVDSFSGDGLAETEEALQRAREMVAAGADCIDIGGESAGTKRKVMSEEAEIDALLPFVERFHEAVADVAPADSEQLFPPLLSVNTWRPAVARAALNVGGDLLNDIGALASDENARICAETGAALLIMHSVGEPKVPHLHIQYENLWETLERFFEEKIAVALNAGMDAESLILDPGIDFAKQREDNLAIYRHLERLHRFERPVLLPVSRKTVIGDVLGIPAPERDAGTVASLVSGLSRGAHLFRVHHVTAAYQSLKICRAILETEG